MPKPILVRSKVNPSIIALLAGYDTRDNQPAVKLTNVGYQGEAPVGAIFNYHSSRWQICSDDDLEAQLVLLDYLMDPVIAVPVIFVGTKH